MGSTNKKRTDLTNQFYLEWGRERRDLVYTKAALELWRECGLHAHTFEYLPDLEEYVTDRAISDWGPGTLVEFKREAGTARIYNPEMARSVDWPAGEASA